MVRGNANAGDRLQRWLEPSVGPIGETQPALGRLTITVLTLLLVAVGVVVAYLVVGRRAVPVERPVAVTPLVALARADVGGNAVNETLVARPGEWLGRRLVTADARGVDGFVNGLGTSLGGLSLGWRRWQNGFVRSYALSMLSGALVVVAALLVVRFS